VPYWLRIGLTVTAPQKGKKPADPIYVGLQVVENTEFPKACPVCGKVFKNFEEFCAGTEVCSGASGLMDYELPGSHQLQVLRNCSCGSTLSVACGDRRNTSPAGMKRRRLFGDLMELLTGTGMPEEQARHRLKVVLRSREDDFSPKSSSGNFPP
jgi:hypothetical protein